MTAISRVTGSRPCRGLAGLGIIQVPAFDVRDEVQLGRLVEVLPDYPAEPMPAILLFPRRRVLAFADWVE